MLEQPKSMGCISLQGGEPSMRDIVRNFLGLIFLMVADVIVMAVFVALIIANYLASKSAFDYLGYDSLPLAKEAFIGQIVGPFFPEATLAHFYAFVVAMVIALGLFVLNNRLFHIWELMKDRKGYLAQNDSQSAQIILNKIHEDILLYRYHPSLLDRSPLLGFRIVQVPVCVRRSCHR